MSSKPFPAEHREILDNAVLIQLQTLVGKTEKEAIWDVFHLLDSFKHHADSLGPSTAHNIHTSLWPHIQSLYETQEHNQVILLCQAALHPALLTSTSSHNAAVFTRKIIASHTALGSYAEALSVFHSLPEAAQNNLLSRFLLFRLAVRGWNQTLARECLAFFAARASREEARDALYACVREAQSAGDRLCTAEALAAAARTWQGEVVVAANVPCLLRCAIRLLNMVAAEEEEQAVESAEARPGSSLMAAEMVNLFRIASEFVTSNVHDDNGETVFHDGELLWFSTNSYNLGVIYCTSWEPGRLVSLFKSCLIFTQALSTGADVTDIAQATLTIFRCHFILASLYISEARIIKTEHTQSLYADVEHHATEFTTMLVDRCDPATTINCPDLLQKHGILCIFQFEALLSRQCFDHLPCIVKQARICKDANVFKALGGCLLQSDAPVQVKSSLLKSIVNQVFEIEKFDSSRLARYLRCMVQVLLPVAEDFLARELLEQAMDIAKQAKEVNVLFPAEEAEWLAAAAFNHGLTKYAARNDMSACHAWLDSAVAMAQHVNDNGQFAASLQRRQQELPHSPLADI
ncbi:hypothetical protein PWT90_02639 [Aphanocladium album]|nr:hypothetical protein PWT90_02639 [Aphanocladium album]